MSWVVELNSSWTGPNPGVVVPLVNIIYSSEDFEKGSPKRESLGFGEGCRGSAFVSDEVWGVVA